MFRLTLIACLVCFVSAVVLVLRPGPWESAEQKAKLDAQILADLIARPDRIGWRMSEDPALLRAMIWDERGQRRYPPPDGMAPLAYEFSEDIIRELTAKQASVESLEWSAFDTTGQELLHCRATPAICLVYQRELLEESLGLHPGELNNAGSGRAMFLLVASLAGLFAIATLWLRRQRTPDVSDFMILYERHLAKRGDLEIALTPRDLKLLSFLEERSGDVVTKDELYDAGWGRDYMPNSRALDQHMINLRRKLDPDKSRPVLIETVHGVGYRLVR